MLLVATEHVEPDGADGLSIEQQVDRTAELNPVQANRQREQGVSRKLPHPAAIVPGP
jgi:hypothetical protein